MSAVEPGGLKREVVKETLLLVAVMIKALHEVNDRFSF